MTDHDTELERLRAGVSCALLLERHPPPWQFDRKESTRSALKYRRGEGEVVIVNHDGRGWWDPQSSAKGDIFDLVQFLDPRLNFGQVRRVLRPFIGLSPTYPEALRPAQRVGPNRSVAERWNARPRLRPYSAAWNYLASERCLPAHVLSAAADLDNVRTGFYGSPWFAHRQDGQVCHVEVRGPDFKGSLRGGTKTVFRFGRSGEGVVRLAVAEAPIDALSLAAIEGMRPDTLYLATGGGMGPGTVQAIEAELRTIATSPAALLASAADANTAGERYAARHAELAATAAVRFERLMPTAGTDWNDVLKKGKAR
jgi:hypothetical protein